MRRWLDRYLDKADWIAAELRGSGEHEYGYPLAMAEDFALTLEDHRDALDDPQAMWGWKAPRTILILPFVHELFAGMRAIHLVRDGRDMAYSRNQQQMRRHAPLLLNNDHNEASEPVRSIAFWANVNLAAARYGERELGPNYLACGTRTSAATRRAPSWSCSTSSTARPRASRCSAWRPRRSGRPPPSGAGASTTRPSSTLHDIAGEALRKFGYE